MDVMPRLSDIITSTGDRKGVKRLSETVLKTVVVFKDISVCYSSELTHLRPLPTILLNPNRRVIKGEEVRT